MEKLGQPRTVPLVYRIVYENLRNRFTRTVLSALAIGIGVAMMLAIVGVAEGMLENQAERARGAGADLMVLPEGMSAIGMSSAPMPEKLAEFVGGLPHVEISTGVIIQPIERIDRITGIVFDEFDRMAHFVFLSGGPFENDDDVILDEYYARQNELQVGDKIELLGRDWNVCGIVEPGKMARVLVQKHIVQELTGAPGKITMIYVKVDDPANTETVKADLEAQLANYQIYTLEEFISQFTANNLPELRIFLRVIIGLSVVFGFLVIFLTMHTAVLERTREIGILKSLGASSPYILGIFVREALALGALGTVAGIGASYVSKFLIDTLIPSSIQQAVVPEWWPRALVITLVGSLLGVLYPAWRASSQDALESLSYE